MLSPNGSSNIFSDDLPTSNQHHLYTGGTIPTGSGPQANISDYSSTQTTYLHPNAPVSALEFNPNGTAMSTSNIFQLMHVQGGGAQHQRAIDGGCSREMGSGMGSKVTLQEAEQLCGYQLLTHAGNLTKIVQEMKELKKAQKQLQQIHSDIQAKKVIQIGSSIQGSAQKSAAKNRSTTPTGAGSVSHETEKLMKQKRDLLTRYEQKKVKFSKNDRLKDQFRAFLFSNHRTQSLKKSFHKGSLSDSLNQFEEVPSNLNNLYFDSIEGKNFTQIKIDLFSSTIRQQFDGFMRQRKDLKEKINGKEANVKILSDMNQTLKKKYIKKQADYKRVIRGEEVQEPANFLEQMIMDIKRSLEDKRQATESYDAQKPASEAKQPSNPAITQHHHATQPSQPQTAGLQSLTFASPQPPSNGQSHQRSLSDTAPPQMAQTPQPTMHAQPMVMPIVNVTPKTIQDIQQQQHLIAQQVQQQRRLEQFEVKTISERSHEDSNSMASSTLTTPGGGFGHQKNYLSGTIQPMGSIQNIESSDQMAGGSNVMEYQKVINENNSGGDKQGKKQIQILDLLNEICEENTEDDTIKDQQVAPPGGVLGLLQNMIGNESSILDSSVQLIQQQQNQQSETEKEEDRIIEQITRVLQTRESDCSSQLYQSLTYTDGIYLQNITGEQLQYIIDYLYSVDDQSQDTQGPVKIPEDFVSQVELFETAEYLGLDDLKIRVVTEGIMKREEFLRYTNVRRHYIDNLNEESLETLFEFLTPNQLVFTLTDPALEQITAGHLEEYAGQIFEQYYALFTANRLEILEKMKEDESQRFVFEEDLMYLTKDYYEVYSDTIEALKMKELISRHIVEQLLHLHAEFKQLPFDFHSCFYYEPELREFKLHRKFLQQDDEAYASEQSASLKQFTNFKKPLVLFSAIECLSFAETCLTNLFSLSKRFSQIRILNLRGLVNIKKEHLLDGIIKNCSQVAHLNLSFIKSVDDDVLEALGIQFQHTLLSLEVRSCAQITDKGIMLMCEALSGIRDKRAGQEPVDETARYRFFNSHETDSKLKFLNLADLKQLSNKAMKSISFNLFPQLVDLSIWGCYRITNEGFLELCTAHRSENFRKVNYCGCYKISEDSRLWISSTFSRVIIYNKVDEFGKEIDYNEVVVNKQV